MLETLPQLLPDPVIDAYKQDVDVSLLLENLKLTPEQRLEKLIQHYQFAVELHGSAKANDRSHD